MKIKYLFLWLLYSAVLFISCKSIPQAPAKESPAGTPVSQETSPPEGASVSLETEVRQTGTADDAQAGATGSDPLLTKVQPKLSNPSKPSEQPKTDGKGGEKRPMTLKPKTPQKSKLPQKTAEAEKQAESDVKPEKTAEAERKSVSRITPSISLKPKSAVQSRKSSVEKPLSEPLPSEREENAENIQPAVSMSEKPLFPAVSAPVTSAPSGTVSTETSVPDAKAEKSVRIGGEGEKERVDISVSALSPPMEADRTVKPSAVSQTVKKSENRPPLQAPSSRGAAGQGAFSSAVFEEPEVLLQADDTPSLLDSEDTSAEETEESAETQEIVPSRVEEVLLYTAFDISCEGKNWIFLGETKPAQPPVVTFSKRIFADERTLFSLRAASPGETILHFYKHDVLENVPRDEYVLVRVIDKQTAESKAFENTVSDISLERERDGESVFSGFDGEKSESSGSAQELYERAETAFNEKRYADSLSLLDEFFQTRTSSENCFDKAVFLKARIYESPSAYRNIRTALAEYKKITAFFPESGLWQEAQRRITYIKRFYMEIR
ncbi:hypothetical protein V1L52_07995 [Treponema sp. HNW]|uniref:hypothetical protein n=1 Tax=Treponema sp. HNW TaxID=3116654 RepID=UPI003D0D863A